MRLLLARNPIMAAQIQEDQEVFCILGDANSVIHAAEGDLHVRVYRLKFIKTTLANVDKMKHYLRDHDLVDYVEPGEWVVLRWFGCYNADGIKCDLFDKLINRPYEVEHEDRVYTMELRIALNMVREVYKSREADAMSAEAVKKYIIDRRHNQQKPKLSIFARIKRCFTRK